MKSSLDSRVFYADSAKFLKKIPKNHVKLVYLDPPFFSDRNYEVISKDGTSNSFGDKWSDGLNGYLDFMKEILQEKIPFFALELGGENWLQSNFEALNIGDYASYHLAQAYGIDPAPVEMVEGFKKRL